MLKALLLILDPADSWEGVALSRRGLGLTLLLYLAPMMLIVAAAEGCGLAEWGHAQAPPAGTRIFTPGQAAVAEAFQEILMLAAIALCAYLIKALGDTFHGRNTYTQAFKVVAYGLSPIFLLRLLDVVPALSLWIPWVIGIMLTMKILYHGVPIVLKPDPPHAFGLYLMSCLLIAMVTAAERFISIGALTGEFTRLSSLIDDLGSRLHF
ncbi:MAG: DUF1282 family protein [Verrucomicrobiota bacterium]|nr:DUF1282 family protein [Verrucomicrobiota bacterium]